MTDRLTPGMLRDFADIHRRYFVHPHKSLADFFIEEAARREAEAKPAPAPIPMGDWAEDFVRWCRALAEDRLGSDTAKALEDAADRIEAQAKEIREQNECIRAWHATAEKARAEARQWEASSGKHYTRAEALEDKIKGLDSDLSFAKQRCGEIASERDALKARAEAAEAEVRRLEKELKSEGKRTDNALDNLDAAMREVARLRELGHAMFAKTSVVLNRPRPPVGSPVVVVEYDAARAMWGALAPVEAKPFTPNKGCKTFDDCRKAWFCMDAWHCSAQAKGGDHGR
jgi:hypothetical protein